MLFLYSSIVKIFYKYAYLIFNFYIYIFDLFVLYIILSNLFSILNDVIVFRNVQQSSYERSGLIGYPVFSES